MSKNAAPIPGQDTLFELDSEAALVSPEVPHVVPSPTAIRARRAPLPHHSEAYEELGGGVVPHEPEVLTNEERLETVSIDFYEKSRHYSGLARRKSSDPELKRAGGKARSEAMAKQCMKEARSAYLRSQDLPTELSDNPTNEQQESYDEAVSAWLRFRVTVLEVDSERIALARELAEHVSL